MLQYLLPLPQKTVKYDQRSICQQTSAIMRKTVGSAELLAARLIYYRNYVRYRYFPSLLR